MSYFSVRSESSLSTSQSSYSSTPAPVTPNHSRTIYTFDSSKEHYPVPGNSAKSYSIASDADEDVEMVDDHNQSQSQNQPQSHARERASTQQTPTSARQVHAHDLPSTPTPALSRPDTASSPTTSLTTPPDSLKAHSMRQYSSALRNRMMKGLDLAKKMMSEDVDGARQKLDFSWDDEDPIDRHVRMVKCKEAAEEKARALASTQATGLNHAGAGTGAGKQGDDVFGGGAVIPSAHGQGRPAPAVPHIREPDHTTGTARPARPSRPAIGRHSNPSFLGHERRLAATATGGPAVSESMSSMSLMSMTSEASFEAITRDNLVSLYGTDNSSGAQDAVGFQFGLGISHAGLTPGVNNSDRSSAISIDSISTSSCTGSTLSAGSDCTTSTVTGAAPARSVASSSSKSKRDSLLQHRQRLQAHSFSAQPTDNSSDSENDTMNMFAYAQPFPHLHTQAQSEGQTRTSSPMFFPAQTPTPSSELVQSFSYFSIPTQPAPVPIAAGARATYPTRPSMGRRKLSRPHPYDDAGRSGSSGNNTGPIGDDDGNGNGDESEYEGRSISETMITRAGLRCQRGRAGRERR